MKRALLAATAVIAFWAAPREAAAQIPVTCTSCPTEITEILRHGKSLAEWGKQLAELQRLYGRAYAIWYAFQNIRDLGTAMQALTTAGISNPLPVDPYALQGLLSGRAGAVGSASLLSGLFNSNAGPDNLQVYDCTEQSSSCELSRRHRSASAGTQAASMQLYDAALARGPHIQSMMAEVNGARDPAHREQLIGALTGANAQASNSLVQAITVQTYAQQQVAMRDQQKEEALKMRIDEVLAAGRARGLVQ